MIRIGLTGVPGSGKSELAAALAARLPNVAVVDDYVPKIEKRTKLAMGLYADYAGNLHVALDRAIYERAIPKRTKYMVTCGTLYDTASYSAIAFEREQQFVTSEEEQQALLRQVDAHMRMLACLFMDKYVYDLVFWLPARDDDPDIVRLNKNLIGAIAGFPIINLDGPQDADKCVGIINDFERALQEQEATTQEPVG